MDIIIILYITSQNKYLKLRCYNFLSLRIEFNMDNQSFSEAVYETLPADIADTAKKLAEKYVLNEIRIRRDLPVSYTVSDSAGVMKNIVSRRTVSQEELDGIVLRLSGGSLHAHENTIAKGYISYKNRRVGVCGSFFERRLRAVTSVCIRLLYPVRGVGGALAKILAEREWRSGVLIYSIPGAGKTTLLRDLAITASCAPYNKRVALMDTRGELYEPLMMKNCLIDTISGKTKAECISIVTRVMSPELIICDEIGGMEDAQAIIDAQNTGVPLIASAHAPDYSSLMRRPGMRLLRDSGIFDIYCGIRRTNAEKGFEFDIKYADKTGCESCCE